MRQIVLLIAVVAAGCMREPTAAEMRLQGACEAGNIPACQAIVENERAERAAIGAILSNPAPAYTPPPLTFQPPTRLQTSCYTIGNTMQCY